MGGEPPAEEKSELLWGESDRLSEEVLSSHCVGIALRTGLFLIGDWVMLVRGLYGDCGRP